MIDFNKDLMSNKTKGNAFWMDKYLASKEKKQK